MRHHSLPPACDVLPLPRRVCRLPALRPLVPPPSLHQRLPPCQLAARQAAVPVAPVTAGAQEEHLPALRPTARHQPKRFPHCTRCKPSSGDTPRPGVRLASPQARYAHGHAAPDGPLSACWEALRLPGRAFRAPVVVPHSLPTSFQSPPPDPHLKRLSPVSMLHSDSVPARATTTTTMMISVELNSTSIRFHADLSDHPHRATRRRPRRRGPLVGTRRRRERRDAARGES